MEQPSFQPPLSLEEAVRLARKVPVEEWIGPSDHTRIILPKYRISTSAVDYKDHAIRLEKSRSALLFFTVYSLTVESREVVLGREVILGHFKGEDVRNLYNEIAGNIRSYKSQQQSLVQMQELTALRRSQG